MLCSSKTHFWLCLHLLVETNQNKWKLVHFENSKKNCHGDKIQESESKSTDTLEMDKNANKHVYVMQKKLRNVFSPKFQIRFGQRSCTINGLSFKSYCSLFNFLFKGSIFSMNMKDALKLRSLYSKLPKDKKKLILKRSKQYIESISR